MVKLSVKKFRACSQQLQRFKSAESGLLSNCLFKCSKYKAWSESVLDYSCIKGWWHDFDFKQKIVTLYTLFVKALVDDRVAWPSVWWWPPMKMILKCASKTTSVRHFCVHNRTRRVYTKLVSNFCSLAILSSRSVVHIWETQRVTKFSCQDDQVVGPTPCVMCRPRHPGRQADRFLQQAKTEEDSDLLFIQQTRQSQPENWEHGLFRRFLRLLQHRPCRYQDFL